MKIKIKNGKAYQVTETEVQYNSNSGELNWMVNFGQGGWNNVWAKTEFQAKKKAKKEYGSDATVRLMTDAGEKAAMRNFY